MTKRLILKISLPIFFFLFSLSNLVNSQFYGKTINSIEFVGDLLVKEKELRSIIDLDLNDLYSREKIRRSVLLLYSKGIYENILVDVVDYRDGVKVTFRLVGRYLIKGIKVKGNFPFVKDTILKAASLGKNSVYSHEDLLKYKDKIRDFLKIQGYRDAKVNIDEVLDTIRKEVDLTITVDKGQKTRIEKLKIDGSPYYSDRRIAKKSGLFFLPPFIDRGKVLKKSTIDNSVKNLEGFYHDEGFYNAEIQKPEIEIDQKRNTARR